MLSHYDFNDEEEPSGHLQVWTLATPGDWSEDESSVSDDSSEDESSSNDDLSEDESSVYMFSDPPKRWKCGIVHLADYTLGSDKELKYKDLLKAVYILTRIQTAGDELDLLCCKNNFSLLLGLCTIINLELFSTINVVK